jgi:DNA-binding XRE family transcriptional regulator
LTLGAAILVAIAVGVAGWTIAREVRDARDEARRSRTLTLLALFATGLEAADRDPRALLVWQPLARAARALFGDELAALDRAAGATFPFPAERLHAAHARWTADWLAWERAHDDQYKRKAAAAEQEFAGAVHAARAAVDAIEREKLDLYQRRYEEYVTVAKGLQALCDSAA